MNEDGIAPADALSVIEDARASEDVSAFLSGLMACWYEHPGRHEPDCSEFISELPVDVDGEKIVLSAPPEDGIHDGGADAEAGSTVSEVASDWSQNDEADVALTSFQVDDSFTPQLWEGTVDVRFDDGETWQNSLIAVVHKEDRDARPGLHVTGFHPELEFAS